MEAYFLGGADEVGASSLLVQTSGCRLLIDAGVRMGSASKDRLPDLAMVNDLSGPSAVLLTHAHLDHCGALPLVHGAFPEAPVYMTEPTLDLIRILLLDALKVMQLRSEKEDEVPLYPLPAVEALLGRVRAVPFLQPVSLDGPAVHATFFPAGHVLGAAAVGISTPEGNLLVTGDVSLTDQLTVPAMPRPRFAPDLVVCESTYGARMHASRRAEEQRLAATVLEALREGRKVLIPAFALGRAQEVLLILRRALRQAGAPVAPVYADGMVRAICGVYGQHTDYLTPTLRNRAREGRGIFFTADGMVRPVSSVEERLRILEGGPCVIVSSSGMLSGGPSAWYASRLVQREDALIAITGYQDEEAPGRHLQEVAHGQRSQLVLDGVSKEVRCSVQSYALSAHADGQQLGALLQSLHPRAVALVHGDADARAGLLQVLSERALDDVWLPASGDRVELPRAAPRRPRQVQGLGKGRPLDLAGLVELHRLLWLYGTRGRTYSAADLAEQWYGSDGCPADLSRLRELLASGQRLFVPDGKRPFLFRAADTEARGKSAAAAERVGAVDESGRLEQNAALDLVDRFFTDKSGLYRKGADRASWSLRLYFHFPLVASEKYASEIDLLAEQSGWQVVVHPETRLASLEDLVRELLGDRFRPLRSASIFNQDRTVKVMVASLPPPELADRTCAAFESQTGYTLWFEACKQGTPASKQVWDESGRMEINLAMAEIAKAFSGLPHAPYKTGKKNDERGPFIELSFVSPEVGARYQELIERLQARTCYRIRVAQSVNQQAVLAAVRELVPDGWPQKRGPGLDLGSRTVRLRLAAAPPPEQLAAFSQKLAELTGFRLTC